MNGKKYTDAAGLGKALHDDPATTNCVINKTYAYAAGRPATKGEADWVAYLKEDFAKNGYRFPDLMRTIVTSDAFYQISAPSKPDGTTQADAASPKGDRS